LADMLESGRVLPVGGSVDQPVDVRFVACASVPLKQRARDGLFREDLLARLSVAEVTLPPLRDRRVDIAALARHFMTRIGALPDMPAMSLSGELIDAFAGWSWPGNVRQLQNVLFRAAVLCEGDALTVADFPQIASHAHPRSLPDAANANQEAGVTLYMSDGHMRPLDDIEADIIRLAIGHYRGRMTEVARRLGIGRSTLYRKLAELGISEVA